ncbi:apoptosis facilitator Bcl-2-like protein 14 [Chanos chanos]|uniref:Apoptosis facilitator Bcl-2-like protein 14 n=1 Tax=Chanos chanos TaxID=29144 RepID=A0A6J2UYG5_CHACN|nr:apoptosis facilitator Bcl-2-like protein 14 [Chanos chanos]
MAKEEGDGNVQDFSKDSFELRLLMAYIQRRRPPDKQLEQSNANRETVETHSELTNGGPQPAMLESKEKDLGAMAQKLTEIAESVHIIPEYLETDGDEDDVQKIVEMLREYGDRLNEQIERNHALVQTLRNSFESYSFFAKVADAFLKRLSPAEIPSTQDNKQTKLALICEITSRLTAIDNHPMNQIMGFGAKYLQEHFSSWINTQGGYEKVLGVEEEVH